MKQREIGTSGIFASEMSMGAWAIGGGTWWGDNDDAESIRTIHSALDQGINWIDTARVYGFGHSEEVVGKAVKDRRHEVILSTKCGLQWYDDGGEYHFTGDGHRVHRDLRPQAIRRDLELSLKALGTDYIDVYYTHWQCKTYGLVPIAETMGELMRMKEEGKIRAIVQRAGAPPGGVPAERPAGCDPGEIQHAGPTGGGGTAALLRGQFRHPSDLFPHRAGAAHRHGAGQLRSEARGGQGE